MSLYRVIADPTDCGLHTARDASPPAPGVARRVRQLATRQWGFLPVAAARAAGIAPETLRTMAHRGHLVHVSHGVYGLPWAVRGPVGPLRAAVMWPRCQGAVLAHAAAAWLWTERVTAHPFTGVVDVIVPAAYRSHRVVPPTMRLWRMAVPRRWITRRWGFRVHAPLAAVTSWVEVSDPANAAEGEDLDYRITAMRDRGLISPAAARTLRARMAAHGWAADVCAGDE